MQHNSFKIEISKELGFISAETVTVDELNAVMTLAHGAGAGMNHGFMVALAKALAHVGIGTIRFNFPYMEHGKKRPDMPVVAHKTIEAVLHQAKILFKDTPIFVSGKSFGGRMSSQYLSSHPIEFVKGIVFFGFPLHPARKPAIDRAEHLKKVEVPMLFLQGTRDTLAEWILIERVVHELPLATLFKFEGADHSFKSGKLDLIPALAQAVKDWTEEVIRK